MSMFCLSLITKLNVKETIYCLKLGNSVKTSINFPKEAYLLTYAWEGNGSLLQFLYFLYNHTNVILHRTNKTI